MTKYLAVYLRLSKDDVDLKSNALKDESDSIHSQRLLLHRYISERAEFENLPVLEFADDGYTGTNFERPGFQQMLSMIRDGEIGCIIVKDLSRFGRNYLEVGDYLEHIFPFLGVRFISVNDNYDSDRFMGTTGGIDVAFRNLIYQRYSQDLSEKVKSAMHLKMSKGKYITHCPYGYRKKPGVKHEMIPNPETAPIVREIFMSAISGMKSTEIAAMLNERQIPTPMVYKNLSRENMHNDAMWSHQAVLRIIKDYKYTGAMVNFKCENATVRAKSQRPIPPEEWVIVEDSHEPIVSHEEYKLANEKIRKVRYTPPKRTDCKDRVYYCGHCGRRLRKTFGLDEYYSCTTQLYRKGAKCEDIFWSRTEIEKVVLAAYKAQLQLMREEYRQISREQPTDSLEECRQRQRAISSELAAADDRNLQLYEQYREGIFDKDEFLQKKETLFKRKKELQQELAAMQAQEETLRQEQSKKLTRRDSIAASDKMLRASDDELQKRMYDAIEKVTVYGSKEIAIEWKADNTVAEMG